MTLRFILKPLGNRRKKPSDVLDHQLSTLLISPNPSRSRLSRLAFKEASANCPIGRMEEAFHKICAVEALEKKIIKATKETTLKSLTVLEQIEEAVSCNILTKAEAKQLKEAELARQEAIKVDDFADKELRRTAQAVMEVKLGDELLI